MHEILLNKQNKLKDNNSLVIIESCEYLIMTLFQSLDRSIKEIIKIRKINNKVIIITNTTILTLNQTGDC